ncbi:LacI family DNA-binding transcriptional regulator [Williamsia sp. CHRR-6]|uniref:LacI family DNA-binding transcriptional regulator n=1 Tax=Williamsia sp. CHRR-6 TaxID=2835871 RepID=UPI001BD95F07|nr:LacI family DNA-binding transcriptional regulator [Williamsia sp. CHRR-6]MBT0566403.1 LacI family DNA-binding transcriptional regulator [Williamsia sp. CHRR-6]
MTDGGMTRVARPTMNDVARLAGVSLKTVSRVVNGEGYIASATAARVEAAIAQIGYRRNEIARRMRPGQESTDLGLLIGDLRNPFFGGVAAAVIAAAHAGGYGVMIASVDEDPTAERHAVEGLISRQVAGLLLVAGGEDFGFLADEIGLGTPVVFLDRPAAGLEADEVVLANEAGAREGTEHLLAGGFTRIAIIVAASRHSTGERLRGYRNAISAALGEVDESLIVQLDKGSAEEAEAAARTLLAAPNPPDAVFATTGFVTLGLLRALDGRTDIGIVGFDDLPLADMLPVPVTVLSSEPTELGTLGVRTLFDRIDGDTTPPRHHEIQPRLVVRSSGRPRSP